MSGTSEQSRELITDFVRWLRHNDTDGQAWYHDAGGPASVPTSNPAPPSTTERATTPAVQDDPPQDEFQRECAAFLQDALTLIDRQGVADQSPLFADPLRDQHGGDKVAALAALRAEVLPCTGCQLHEGRNHTVFGAGNPDANLVLIGEAPGRDEDLQGEPFVGRSGQLLTKILAAIDFDRDQVFICNILKCRPPNNRDPQTVEVLACEPHLKRQLAILQPDLICCLGRIAAQTLLGTSASLRKMRETVHFYAGIPVLATYHPAALLRNPGWKRDAWNDVRRLRALYDALQTRK